MPLTKGISSIKLHQAEKKKTTVLQFAVLPVVSPPITSTEWQRKFGSLFSRAKCPFTHASFGVIFVALFNAIFVAATSQRFRKFVQFGGDLEEN